MIGLLRKQRSSFSQKAFVLLRQASGKTYPDNMTKKALLRMCNPDFSRKYYRIKSVAFKVGFKF